MIKVEFFNEEANISGKIALSDKVLSFFNSSQDEIEKDEKNTLFEKDLVEYFIDKQEFTKILELFYNFSGVSFYIPFPIFIVFYLKFLGYQDEGFREILGNKEYSNEEKYQKFLERQSIYKVEGTPHIFAPDILLSFLCHIKYFFFGAEKIEVTSDIIPYILNIKAASLDFLNGPPEGFDPENPETWEKEQKSFFEKFNFLNFFRKK